MSAIRSLKVTTVYPVNWPSGFPRILSRKRSPFKSRPFRDARRLLADELRRLGASEAILSTNLPIRTDEEPIEGRSAPSDPGVAVHFVFEGQKRALACDKWETTAQNVVALTETIDRMRALERYGASDILRRAFTGLTALPAPEAWWDVLGVSPKLPLKQAEDAYRHMMKTAHPDMGGSEYKASKLNWAIGEARRTARATS